MTIQLTQARVVSGSVAASGSQHTLDEATEAYFVEMGWATYVGAEPYQGGSTVPASLATDSSGNVTGLVGADGLYVRTEGQKYASIAAISDVVAFWDFSEPRAPFYSKAGKGLFPLEQGSGSRVTKTSNGPLGHAVSFNGTSDYLKLAAANVGELNIGGSGGTEVCVLAFVKRSSYTNTSMIAGCWKEAAADPRRQYALFVDLPTYGGDNKVCFHVSKTGGASPNIDYSRDYSANYSSEPNLDWICVAGSYDGSHARSYIEGRFEEWLNYTETSTPGIGEGLTYDKNPYAFADGLNTADCDFTVGACELTSGMSNFFAGELAALLVMRRAPTLAEVAEIQNAINPATYGFKNRLFQWSQTSTAPNALTGCGAYLGATGIDKSALQDTFIRTAIAGAAVEGFVYRSSASTAGIGLFTCESVPEGITTGNLSTLSFDLANANTGDTVRFCIKIDGAWYATEATYAVSVASASGGDWSNKETKTIAFAKTAANWRDIALVVGSTLTLAGAARGTNLPDGDITGWGIYSPGVPTGHVRFRNFEAITI